MTAITDLMSRVRLAADSPGYLVLLALLPALWWFSDRSLAGLGRWRRWSAIGLRTAVTTLLILTAAEVQWVRTSDRLTVIYLLDQSLSIPAERRAAMIDYVNAAIARQRDGTDRAGVIVFGREAQIEAPPFDDDVQVPRALESQIDPEYTNLAAALKLAQASFQEDSARRIVIVSDGNENIGNVREQALAVVEAGIGIDVVPIAYEARSEVAVERLALPADIRRGQPFDMRIVLNNTTQPRPGHDGTVAGRLIVSEKTDDQPVVLSEQRVELPPGKRVLTLRQQIDRPNFYDYEARFVPDNPADDALPQNNRATAFTHVRGSGQVLLIEDVDHRGEHDLLIDQLRKDNLEVTVRPSNQLFTGLPELQPFDTVILANVPREAFSDQQIAMLARNTHDLASGLIMLGGPSSFGAGGWASTEVEEALPLDFNIKSAKVVAKGALALVMHASEMPDGNFWQKKIAMEAIKALGPEDYCGVIHWNGTDQWLWGGLRPVGGSRDQMLAAVDRMAPGDMPDFDPGLVKVQRAFANLKDAAVKHMIVISDGDPQPPSAGVVRGLKALNVTVSSVAVGCHGPAESAVMKRLADATGGKYYEVNDPRALPRIFQREARRVARPLIYEDAKGFRPRIVYPHEIVSGIGAELPPLTGYVMTTIKQNPLVEVSIVSPVPEVTENATILASWTYGLGKSACLTTDAGARWAGAWTAWPNYGKLVVQLVRWSLRPSGDSGKFTVATDVSDGRVHVVVTALDANDEFLNFLDLSGGAIGPDMKSQQLRLKQTAPGRYVGSFEAKDSGSYFLSLSPGAGQPPIRTGVNVPYSAEFRDQAADVPLLRSLAALAPKKGPPGAVIGDPAGGDALEPLLATNTFRHDLPKAVSTHDAWPNVLLVAALVFVGDVFTRRVSLSLAWMLPAARRMRDALLRRPHQAPPSAYLERLRSRKAEVVRSLDQQRAGTRFEPPPTAPPAGEPAAIEPPPAPTRPVAAPPETHLAPEAKTEPESYTSRLLKAKKKVWEERGQENKGE